MTHKQEEEQGDPWRVSGALRSSPRATLIRMKNWVTVLLCFGFGFLQLFSHNNLVNWDIICILQTTETPMWVELEL